MSAPVNKLKSALASGQVTYGCWSGFADPYATEMLASANFDWIVIDAEHAPNDLTTIMAQLQILEGKQSNAVVRLPVGEAWMIKQVLDAGAQSLVIPMVESAEEARDLVRAMRYPPEGIRGSGAALARASRFSDIPNYIPTANAQMCLIVQVETTAGIAALDEICQVDGVDCVFIGPSDLAADMGYQGDSTQPEVKEAIRDALARITAAGKAPGILAVDDETAVMYRDWGAQFLAVGIDVLMLVNAARATMARWRDG